MDHATLDENHRVVKCDLMTWAQWMESEKGNRVVQQTAVGEVSVSTVFLGLDHGFGGKPKWFESMVFGGTMDGEQERYETWNEAVAGHEKLVARVKESA